MLNFNISEYLNKGYLNQGYVKVGYLISLIWDIQIIIYLDTGLIILFWLLFVAYSIAEILAAFRS